MSSNPTRPTADIHRRGLLLVLSSPSGAGKSTICKKLLATDDALSMSVSVTTRSPRPGEIDGKDYRFVDHPTFERMVAAEEFLEHALVFGNHYGTPRAQVTAELLAGRDVLFDIDWQGTQQLAQSAERDLVRVFILPPSAEELERRLRGRAQDSEEVIARRMAKASDEMSHWAEYDYVIVNDNLDLCFDRVQMILQTERLKRRRQVGLAELVKRLQRAE
ncbi:MAG: guanylate kinase [Rhodospirillaceae bacterium]